MEKEKKTQKKGLGLRLNAGFNAIELIVARCPWREKSKKFSRGLEGYLVCLEKIERENDTNSRKEAP